MAGTTQPPASAPAVHLVVIQHGLWGTPANMAALLEHLERQLPQQAANRERVVIENSGEGPKNPGSRD